MNKDDVVMPVRRDAPPLFEKGGLTGCHPCISHAGFPC